MYKKQYTRIRAAAEHVYGDLRYPPPKKNGHKTDTKHGRLATAVCSDATKRGRQLKKKTHTHILYIRMALDGC